MDLTKDFSMLYSGVENDTYFQGCYAMGVRNFLMSFQYVCNKNITSKYGDLDIKLFIDSGAFTYMGDAKYYEYTDEQWEKQIMSYLSWAEKHKDIIFAMANLDLDKIVGTAKVKEWNEKYFEPFMIRTGIPVCFVYHKEEAESVVSWDWWCQRYPYVGVSFTSDDPPEFMHEIFNTAEKYNTVIHGFGMTRTSILPDLPFYTVDSTSWKSGFRYGQLAIWNGKKVQMFKKDDWAAKALKYIRSYPDLQPPLNEDLLYAYDEPEVLRANVYAYQKAEEYIRFRHKSIAYWKKARTTKRDLEDLPEGIFPSVEVLISGTDDELIAFAQGLNINPEYSEVVDTVIDMTVFMNWENEDYKSFIDKVYGGEDRSERLSEVHGIYINRIVETDEEKIEDLQEFFSECLSGKNDKLLQLGTNFDRTVKERKSYIEEEDEYDLQDVPIEVVRAKLGNILDMPKEEEESTIENLDREIFDNAGIVPTFDSRGKFVKGQIKVRKPKKVYSNKFPKMACDSCQAAQKCPEYKAGYVCAYNKLFNRFSTRDVDDVTHIMEGMVDQNIVRMQKAMVMETINGVIDPQVTAFIDQNTRLLAQLQQIRSLNLPTTIHQIRSVKDGKQETVTRVVTPSTNPQSGGILSKLFMEDPSPKKAEGEVIDVEVKESEKNED